MKLKNKKIKKYLLLNLFLLKYKLYNKTQFNHYFLTQLVFELKTFLKIIYSYHISKKKILFLGSLENNPEFFVNFGDNNFFLDKTLLVDGMLTNKISLNNYLKKKKINFFNTDFKLVVVFNATIKDYSFLKELVKSNIPIILIGSGTEMLLNDKFTYRFMTKLTKKGLLFCQFLVYSILKKNKLYEK